MKRKYIDFRKRKKKFGYTIQDKINLVCKWRKRFKEEELVESILFIKPGKYYEDININTEGVFLSGFFELSDIILEKLQDAVKKIGKQ